MGYSDLIAQYLLSGIGDRGGIFEASRVELAQRFGCVPSQINYVLQTRFSPEHGYLVETKRGGGGYIRITRVRLDRDALVMHTINAIGDNIDQRSAAAFLSNLQSVLEDDVLYAISAAISDRALRRIPPELRGGIRADIMKACLLIISS